MNLHNAQHALLAVTIVQLFTALPPHPTIFSAHQVRLTVRSQAQRLLLRDATLELPSGQVAVVTGERRCRRCATPLLSAAEPTHAGGMYTAGIPV